MKKRMRKLSEEMKNIGLEELDGIIFEESDKHVMMLLSKKPEFVERAGNILWSIQHKFEKKQKESKEEKSGYIG